MVSEEVERAGFCVVVGRTNVGKSALINAVAGERATIVSRHPNTTRRAVRVVTQVGRTQLVLVDTPGQSLGHDELARRCQRWCEDEWQGADLALLAVDAARGCGLRERDLARRLRPDDVAVVTRCDLVPRARVVEVLAQLAAIPLAAYFATSAHRGEGVAELRSYLADHMPPGPPLYESDLVVDVPRATWVAEVVREELLHHLRDELPESLACTVESWSEEGVEVVIYVERPSQRPIVIGSRGRILADVRRRAQRRLPTVPPLVLRVKVARDWRRSPRMLDDLGV